MLITIKNFCDEITAENSRNYKKQVLLKWKNNKELTDIFSRFIFNPFVTFGVTSDSMLKYSNSGSIHWELHYLLERLSSRSITGTVALFSCKSFYSALSDDLKPVFCKLLDKNLKIGVSVDTINECWGNIIPTFECALAFDIKKSPSYQKKVDTTNYLIMRKLDGVRCITIIKNSEIKCYSRVGNEFTSLQNIKNALKPYIYKLDNMVLDGEMCVIDNDGNENFKQAVSETKRLNTVMERPHYKIFDILTYEEFTGVKQSVNYANRLIQLRNIFKDDCSGFLSVLGAVKYNPDNLLKAKQIVQDRGYEGLILRADAPYLKGRTSDILKVKVFTDAEYIIEDITSTTKQMKQLDGSMIDIKCAGAFIIRHKGNPVAVGSGLSDALRIDAWNNQDKYIGKRITVKYFEETTDNDGNPSLRFPIFKGFRDIVE